MMRRSSCPARVAARPLRVMRPSRVPSLLAPTQQTIAKARSVSRSVPSTMLAPAGQLVSRAVPRPLLQPLLPSMVLHPAVAARFASTLGRLNREEPVVKQYEALKRHYGGKLRSLHTPAELMRSEETLWKDELLNRTEALNLLRKNFGARWSEGCNDREGNPLLYAIGAPGTGKSRLGDEVHKIMQEASMPLVPKEARVTITRAFGKDAPLLGWPKSPVKDLFCAALLIRSALLPDVPESELLPLLKRINVYSEQCAMDIIHYAVLEQQKLPRNTPVAITLVFDNVEELLHCGEHAIYALTGCLSDLLLSYERPTAEKGGVYVTAVLIGSSYNLIVRDSTWATVRRLPLPCLSQADSERLAEVALNRGQPIAWGEYPLLRHALWLCGGWPRVLQLLVEAVKALNVPLEALREFREFESVMSAVTEHWSRRCGLSSLSPALREYLMAASVLRLRLRPIHPLPSPPSGVSTVDDAVSQGLCGFEDVRGLRCWTDTLQQTGAYVGYVFVPPLILANWASSIRSPAARALADVLYRLQQRPTADAWQAVEVAASEWLALRLAMLHWVREPKFDLSYLFGSAWSEWGHIHPRVSLHAPDTPCLKASPHRWPGPIPLPQEMQDGRHVVTLPAGSPVDIVAPLVGNIEPFSNEKLIWLCLKISSTKTNKSPLTEKEVSQDLRRLDEHLRRLPPGQRPPGDQVVIVYVTNRTIDLDREELEREKRVRFVRFEQLALLPPAAAELWTHEKPRWRLWRYGRQ